LHQPIKPDAGVSCGLVISLDVCYQGKSELTIPTKYVQIYSKELMTLKELLEDMKGMINVDYSGV